MDQLDLLLRGAALGLFGLCCGLLWATETPTRKALSMTALCATVAGYVVVSSPNIDLGAGQHVAVVAARLTPLALTWVVLELFFDCVGDRWPWLVYSGLTVILEQFRSIIRRWKISVDGWFLSCIRGCWRWRS